MTTPPRTALWALLLSSCALLLTIWIAVPAPHHLVWQLAVGASEWGLWLAALALLGVLLGIRSLRTPRSATSNTPAVASIALGLCAVLLGLYPLASAWPVASAQGVSLSFGRYFLGALDNPSGPAPQTVTFHTVDGQNLQLDVFLPAATAAGTAPLRPAVIVVHGGGWDSRDKSDFPQWDYWLNQHGYAVFDIQYRLHPQPNWQSATGDVKCLSLIHI